VQKPGAGDRQFDEKLKRLDALRLNAAHLFEQAHFREATRMLDECLGLARELRDSSRFLSCELELVRALNESDDMAYAAVRCEALLNTTALSVNLGKLKGAISVID
jgi:hypothetical protein